MDIVQPENLIQTLRYHSSCSQNLFLKDRFGSVQLVVFINEDEGEVTCFQNVTLSFDIAAPVEIEGGSAELTALTVVTNILDQDGGLVILDLGDKVAGVIVTPEMPFVVEATLTIDLTERTTRYTAFSTIVGQTDKGIRCFGVNVFTFGS